VECTWRLLRALIGHLGSAAQVAIFVELSRTLWITAAWLLTAIYAQKWLRYRSEYKGEQ
jgi:hypothetical protein